MGNTSSIGRFMQKNVKVGGHEKFLIFRFFLGLPRSKTPKPMKENDTIFMVQIEELCETFQMNTHTLYKFLEKIAKKCEICFIGRVSKFFMKL